MTLDLLNDDTTLADIGGMVGVIHTYEVTPRVNPARVRPFVYSILLLRGGVRADEVEATIAPHAHPDDVRCWDFDATQLQLVIAYTLEDLVKKEILRRSDDGLYVFATTAAATTTAISVTAATDGQLPDHLLADMARHYYPFPR